MAYNVATQYSIQKYYKSLSGEKEEKEEEEEDEAEDKPLDLNSQISELSITPADEPDDHFVGVFKFDYI